MEPMTIKRLENYAGLVAKVEALRGYIEPLMDKATDSHAHINETGVVSKPGKSDKTSKYASLIADVTAQLEAYNQEIRAVEGFIAAVAKEDSLLSAVVDYKYIQGYPYRYIEFKINESLKNIAPHKRYKGNTLNTMVLEYFGLRNSRKEI